jgi:hypothetical protein
MAEMATLSLVRLVGGVGCRVLAAVGMVEVPIDFILRVVYQSSWKYNYFGFQSKPYFMGHAWILFSWELGLQQYTWGILKRSCGARSVIFFFF